MATRAIAFVTLISGLNRLLAAGSTHQQVCRLWQGEADVYVGLIGLGKEDGVCGCEAAPAPPPTSHTGTSGPGWNPPGAPKEVRRQMYLLGQGSEEHRS